MYTSKPNAARARPKSTRGWIALVHAGALQGGGEKTDQCGIDTRHRTLHAVTLAQGFLEREGAGHAAKVKSGPGHGLGGAVSGEESIVGDQPPHPWDDARLQKRQCHMLAAEHQCARFVEGCVAGGMAGRWGFSKARSTSMADPRGADALATSAFVWATVCSSRSRLW